jgi:hypothetical protein
MRRQGGMYLVKQKSAEKGVDHYGILVVDRWVLARYINALHPMVLQQGPPSIHWTWFRESGSWEVLAKIVDEAGAMIRIHAAIEKPEYDLFGNNCEHFARFVASGRRESTQLQAVGALAVLATCIFLFKWD